MTASAARDLHLPSEGAPRALAVVLHPHPGMGGDRSHPLVVAVAEQLAAAGVAAARVDLPDPDVDRAAAALEEVGSSSAAELGVEPVLLVGCSWGSVVVAHAAPSGLVARALVAPPVRGMALPPDDEIPLLALVPRHDQYGPPDDVAAALDGRPAGQLEVIEGCDHFLAGAVGRIAERAVDWAVAQLER